MAHSCCTELSEQDKQQLLGIAQQAIASGLTDASIKQLDIDSLPQNLREISASFVTLTQQGELRGCMGNLEANQPLAQSVAQNAYNAAFRDPRFPPLTNDVIGNTQIEISVLSAMLPIEATNRDDLIAQLRPGVDGLMLEHGRHRATFLPKVWEKLDGPQDFLQQLLLKSGLPSDYWSDNIHCYRYHTLSFS